MNVKATSLISHTQVQMGLAIYYSEKKINYNVLMKKKAHPIRVTMICSDASCGILLEFLYTPSPCSPKLVVKIILYIRTIQIYSTINFTHLGMVRS